MRFKTRVLRTLEDITIMLEALSNRLEQAELKNEQLEALNKSLMDERRDLLNRIMAVNYEKYSLYDHSGDSGIIPGSLKMDQLEDFAGEIVRMDKDES